MGRITHRTAGRKCVIWTLQSLPIKSQGEMHWAIDISCIMTKP